MTDWPFYGRTRELGGLLARLRDARWGFGTIQGRRRIGKTALVSEALRILDAEDRGQHAAMLVRLADDAPENLAYAFREAAKRNGFGDLLGADGPVSLRDMALDIGRLCDRGVLVVLDEFQVCHRGRLRSLPSWLQGEVDRLHDSAAPGKLVLLGSVQTQMAAMLQDPREPLYGRTDFSIPLGPWDLATIFQVCDDLGVRDPRRILTLWTLFGGVPKYWRHCFEAGLAARGNDLRSWVNDLCSVLFLEPDAPLAEEGDIVLGGELRPAARAVLRAVAVRGRSARAGIAGAAPGVRDPGSQLRFLTEGIGLVRKELPFGAGPRSRNERYVVADPFLRAWLGVLRPVRDLARMRPRAIAARVLTERLAGLEGLAFEEIVKEAIIETSRAGHPDFPVSAEPVRFLRKSRPGRPGFEIDVVAWDEEGRRVRFGSCKRNAREHTDGSVATFRSAVEAFLLGEGSRFSGWKRELALFSPAFTTEQRASLGAQGLVCRDLGDYRGWLRDRSRGANGPPIAHGGSPRSR